ncbi:Signal transduction histidine kinase [Oceanicola granulosus HTCC2516]|uniref:histidine kinase n=1 Tax=Oceanicola granulosus (strain ATCC BAA-861 / DSM 15982 / KCTC 12143 / HTCC2516) TaxID=314256 RepID=Q2CB23_OCEGH|nr:hybrid sensor histidine kinase/response regulator [Oceanicola granulosus]EAR49853.1 Signal transduction histidine kinase [Oceanicola granulosus HTCC2516]
MTLDIEEAPRPEWSGIDPRGAVAILAPHGRDAAVAKELLRGEKLDTLAAASLAELAALVERQIGAVLVTEEALIGPGSEVLSAALEAQPTWSDVPFIVLANGSPGARSSHARSRMDQLGNAVLLSRPLHVEELLRAVRSALTARRRQHEARERLEELQLRERQLRDSEAKFNAIANSVDHMIWTTLPDGYHDYYNDRWYEFTGVPVGSTDGEAWNGMFHPDDQERAWATWRHSLATGAPYEIEYRLRHRSGEYRWVLGRAHAVRDAAGEIRRWYGSCTDIHDEVLHREARVSDLTQQRDRAWNLSLDLMMVATVEGEIVTLNAAWTRILGWPVDELDSARLGELIHPDDLPTTAAVFEQLRERPLIEPYEYRIRARDGSYRWFAWTGSTHEGRVYAAGRDVTERKAKDAALQATEAALRQSQKLDMIGQLTGGVAHDFNNLLMAIRSSLELLRRRLPSDEQTRRYLDNAIRATSRGAGLTQRMLAFARKQDLRSDAVDVGALLPDLRELLQRSLGPQVEIVIEVAEELPAAEVDLNQLEMAILNLAVNARDAMDGDGQLTLRAEPLTAQDDPDLTPGDYVRITVRDTGSGMDAETLAQAMEPFFTTKGVGKGTGLGLSMVHGLAKQSGGTFRMDSAPGAGTAAMLYLPVAQAAGADEPAADAAPAPEPERAHKERLTIVAVDDDVLVSMGTVGLLEDLGHEVIECHSGKEALAALAERDDVDLLITDHAMPRMTGVELAREVRALRPDLPIILATGYADMPAGGADYITARLEKPFSDSALADLLAELT